jgi:hypothetical protein
LGLREHPNRIEVKSRILSRFPLMDLIAFFEIKSRPDLDPELNHS